jgi:hypothetical protein
VSDIFAISGLLLGQAKAGRFALWLPGYILA